MEKYCNFTDSTNVSTAVFAPFSAAPSTTYAPFPLGSYTQIVFYFLYFILHTSLPLYHPRVAIRMA